MRGHRDIWDRARLSRRTESEQLCALRHDICVLTNLCTQDRSCAIKVRLVPVCSAHSVSYGRTLSILQIVRNVRKYRDSAMIEIKILEDLGKTFDSSHPFVTLWDW